MRHLNIHARYGNARLHRYNSYIGEVTPAPANLANRNFHSDELYTLLVTDVSEFHTRQGKIYFSPLIDCHDGKIVSSAIAQQPNQQLTLTMLTRFFTLLPQNHANLIIHSDRGGHYRSHEWIRLCEQNNVTRSMSRKGNSGDNARCEGFFGRVKQELYYHQTWETPQELTQALEEYITFYNTTKINAKTGLTIPEQRAQAAS